MIYRVQDREGRGPYRPGFSQRWADEDGPDCPPWWIETGESMEAAMSRMSDPSLHYGCGFDTLAQLHQWFTRGELRRLDRLGFKLVSFAPDKIIARTDRQVVFGHGSRLASLSPRVSLVSKIVEAA